MKEGEVEVKRTLRTWLVRFGWSPWFRDNLDLRIPTRRWNPYLHGWDVPLVEEPALNALMEDYAQWRSEQKQQQAELNEKQAAKRAAGKKRNSERRRHMIKIHHDPKTNEYEATVGGITYTAMSVGTLLLRLREEGHKSKAVAWADVECTTVQGAIAWERDPLIRLPRLEGWTEWPVQLAKWMGGVEVEAAMVHDTMTGGPYSVLRSTKFDGLVFPSTVVGTFVAAKLLPHTAPHLQEFADLRYKRMTRRFAGVDLTFRRVLSPDHRIAETSAREIAHMIATADMSALGGPDPDAQCEMGSEVQHLRKRAFAVADAKLEAVRQRHQAMVQQAVRAQRRLPA